MKQNIWTNKYFAAVMALTACLLWGSSFPVLKVTYAELGLGPQDISARMLIAGARFFQPGHGLCSAASSWRNRGCSAGPAAASAPVSWRRRGCSTFLHNAMALVSGVKGPFSMRWAISLWSFWPIFSTLMTASFGQGAGLGRGVHRDRPGQLAAGHYTQLGVQPAG